MKVIITDLNHEVLVDDDTAERLKKVVVRVDSRGYPFFYRYHGLRKRKVYLHRYLLKAPQGYVTDHINGNRLDVRTENLRLLTAIQNTRNRMKIRDARCPFKGVFVNRKKFRSVIVFGYCKFELGIYATAEEAAAMYDAAAEILDNAYKLNFPSGDSRVMKAREKLKEHVGLWNQLNNAIHPKHEPLPMGVSRNGTKYQAQIKINGKRIHLGTFDSPEQASLCYIKAAENRKQGITEYESH
jgi:hypothetical protein